MAKKQSEEPVVNILDVQKALNEAKVPTVDRYGYIIKEDGSVEPFGPITYSEFVPTNHKPSNVKIRKVE